MAALVVFRLLLRGFSSAELRVLLAPLLGLAPDQLTAGQMTYPLRRRRRHELIERLPRQHRYQVTSQGWRMALFCTRAVNRLLKRAWPSSCRARQLYPRRGKNKWANWSRPWIPGWSMHSRLPET